MHKPSSQHSRWLGFNKLHQEATFVFDNCLRHVNFLMVFQICMIYYADYITDCIFVAFFKRFAVGCAFLLSFRQAN